MAKVAFLGLGVMGYPMAGHLQKKGGHEVTVYNRSAAKAQQWVAEYGGRSAPTPREAAASAEFVLMCVGNDNDIRSVVYGDQGALAGMKAGAVFVDHTTASADIARELHAKCKAGGIGFVDAPVSGGQAGAVNGQLGIMCGGEDDVFAKVKPVLDTYAKSCVLIGSPGAGPREMTADLRADAAGTAGDDRRPAVESHGVSPVVSLSVSRASSRRASTTATCRR